MIRTKNFFVLPGLMAGLGCNSFDDPSPAGPDEPRLVIPTDTRTAVQASTTPPPVSGGTLLASSDGMNAVVSDPDRDRIVIADLAAASVRERIELESGDEPGRAAEDAARRVHVALRGGGAVVTIDLVEARLVDRREACSAPRGIAYDAATDSLHVACAGGELVTLPAAGGEPTRTLELGPDLRDVVVLQDRLVVTRLRSAEVLEIDAEGTISNRRRPVSVRASAFRETTQDDFTTIEEVSRRLEPAVAWRAIPKAQGGIVVLHQRAVADEVDLSAPGANESSYGGGGPGCGSIVQPAVTTIGADGAEGTTAPVPGATLAVDIAVSPDGRLVALANAGTSDPEAPRPELVFPENGDIAISGGGPAFPGGDGVQILSLENGAVAGVGAGEEPNFSTNCAPAQGGPIAEPTIAVAFNPVTPNQLLAQTRQPSRLIIVDEAPWGAQRVIALGGDSTFDTGHEIFHRDSGGGIACASCHPEGREDGRVWHFSEVGARRTQALNVGLRGTEPFHWDGELGGLGDLMNEVFVGRMGGVRQSAERLDVLNAWVFALEPLAPLREADDPAVERGRELFHSTETGCSDCHAGDKLTNNATVAVGTGSGTAAGFQVPSLVALGHRAPFMHDGCAENLGARFDPACGGGELHGKTAHLGEAERADLIAYLESL
jgi:hypothetical protein